MKVIEGGEWHGTTIITVIVTILQLGTSVEVIDNGGILLKAGIGGNDLGDHSPCRLLLPHRDHLLQRLNHRRSVVVLVEDDHIDGCCAGKSGRPTIYSFNLVNKLISKLKMV